MIEKKMNINENRDDELFVIPNEAACSPEFAEGCCLVEDKDVEEKVKPCGH